jgi:hypothetical protein
VSTFVVVLLCLGAGLFVGSQLSRTREAHAHFTSHRHRTTADFVAWVRSGVVAVLSVAGLLLLIYVLLALYPRT